jgi:hypothetical protein
VARSSGVREARERSNHARPFFSSNCFPFVRTSWKRSTPGGTVAGASQTMTLLRQGTCERISSTLSSCS